MSADTELTPGRDSLPDSDPVIEYRHAGYRLPKGRVLLRDLNLVVQRGETLVLGTRTAEECVCLDVSFDRVCGAC